MSHTTARHISAGDFDGYIPLSQVTGETADISEYLLMCYHIYKNGKIFARSSVQRMTRPELQTTEYKGMFEEFDKSIKEKLKCRQMIFVYEIHVSMR